MNQKITARKEDGKLVCCILSGDESLEEQLNIVYFDSPNPKHGMCVCFDGSEIAIVDYYHAERVSAIKVVSIEDTESDLRLEWIDAEDLS